MTELNVAFFGFLGTVMGGVIIVFGQWLTHRQDERRSLMEFAIKTAIENRRQMAEKTDRLKAPHHQYGLSPMDGYLIRMLALVQILQRRDFTPKNIRKRLAELDSIGLVLEQHLDKRQSKESPNDKNQN